MPASIGAIFGGRTPRGSPRHGRCAPLGLEHLEPRLLLANDVPLPTAGLFLLAPAQVAAFQPVAVTPVTLHLSGGDATVPASALTPGNQEGTGVLHPGGGIDAYWIPVAPGTASLRLDLTWTGPPPGASGSLLVFDGAGNLLIDQALDAAGQSTTIILSGPLSTTGGGLYVGIQTGQPGGADNPAGASAYDLRVTLNPASVVCDAFVAESLELLLGIPTAPASPPPVTAHGPAGGVPVSGIPVGPVWSGSGQPSPGTQSGSTSCPPPSPARSPGPVAFPPPARGGPNAAGNPSPSTPIDARPLPGSPHEPAGGILTDGAPAERVDRGEETRVEMSLVLLLSPAHEGSRGNEPSADASSAIASSSRFDSGLAAPRGNVVPLQPTSSEEPRSLRPEGVPFLRSSRLPSAVPPPLTVDGLLGDALCVSSAILPPIDGPDRAVIAAPTRRWDGDNATGDEGPPELGRDRSGAILLGLSGSAALGVGLYAPDLAAAVRRALPRPVPNPRSRPASSRDPRAPR